MTSFDINGDQGMAALSDDPKLKALLKTIPWYADDDAVERPLEAQLAEIRELDYEQAKAYRALLADIVGNHRACIGRLEKLMQHAVLRIRSLAHVATMADQHRGKRACDAPPSLVGCVYPKQGWRAGDPPCGNECSTRSPCCGQPRCDRGHSEQRVACGYCGTNKCVLCDPYEVRPCQYCDVFTCDDCKRKHTCCSWTRHGEVEDTSWP